MFIKNAGFAIINPSNMFQICEPFNPENRFLKGTGS